jgi:hypothetical protein
MPTVGYRLPAAPRLRRRLDEVVHSSEPGSRTASSPPTAIPALTPLAVFAVLPPPGPPPPGGPLEEAVDEGDAVLEGVVDGVADVVALDDGDG